MAEETSTPLMLVELAVMCMDVGSAFEYTIDPDHALLPWTSGTTLRRLLLRGPRLPPLVTCSTSANATAFSGVDSTVTFTPKATQDTPALGSVVERLERTLEEGEKNIKHDPSGSMTLGGECSSVQSQTIQGDEHRSLSIDEYLDPSAAAVREPALCPPGVARLHHEQESGHHTLETRTDANNAKFERVLSSASEEQNGAAWDVARDDEILGYFYHNRWNLVLDSVSPEYAPHIVITQVEETWEDQRTGWLNRVDIQWPCYLMVPQINMSIGGLRAYESTSQPLPDLSAGLPPMNNSPPLVASCGPLPVFSPSRFRQCIESAAVERLVLTQVVKILQKAQCKATFFDASSLARSFRKRYDALPSILSNIDPEFTWSDPAEPILNASRRLFGTTILDSICPFLVPHIVINAPPPQPLQLTENNATPYIQDAGFGQQLIVPSYSVEIINAAEEWSPYTSAYSDDASSDVDAVDPLESESPSRPGTPVPETPVDGDDDHYYFLVRYGDEGQDDDMRARSVHLNVYGSDSGAEIETTIGKLQATSRPMFFIDEDEDDLPSLDGW